jgi:hypothetical protein
MNHIVATDFNPLKTDFDVPISSVGTDHINIRKFYKILMSFIINNKVLNGHNSNSFLGK